MTRNEQKEYRRQQILLFSLELFIKKGFTATQIADIADAAQISPGLLFHYFESKEVLYTELVELGFQELQSIQKITATEPIQFFEQFADRLFCYLREQPWSAKLFVLMQQAQSRDDTPKAAHKIASRMNLIEKSTMLIEAGQHAGNIRLGNPLALSNAFWLSIQGIMAKHIANTQMPLPQASWIVDILRA